MRNLSCSKVVFLFFFFQAEDGIRDKLVTGVQTCALPIFVRAAVFAPILLKNKITSPKKRISGQRIISRGARRGASWKGTAKERAVVATETLKGIGFALLTCAEDGEAAQAASSGAPEHARVTAPVNPAAGVSCSSY